MGRIVGICLLAVAVPVVAMAQPAEGRGFVALDISFQSADGETTQTGSFTAYDEAGSFSATQELGGGTNWWFGGGVRVWQSVGIGAAYSRFSNEMDTGVTVTAPHPLVFDQPRTATATPGDFRHDENAFHLQALYMREIGDELEVTVGGGPSFFAVTRQVVTSAGFSESGFPFSTINVTDVVGTEADKTVVGFNLGGEVAFYPTPNWGVGVALRITHGGGDLELPGGGTAEVDAGGVMIGAGVRARF